MKPSSEFPELIDLSFLTTDEEAVILKVLQRDEVLRKTESGRVRRLKASNQDPQQVRDVTGEWFEDLKARRYGHPCDITAVVKSSMRKRRTPAHKINPFMDYAETEDRRDNERTDPNPLSSSRHLPVVIKETHQEYTNEDHGHVNAAAYPEVETLKSPICRDEKGKQGAHGSLSPSLGADPVVSARIISSNHSPGVSDLLPTETTSFTLFQSASQATSPKDVRKAAEPSRRVSLPPALRKGASVEDSWVKISVEPNTAQTSDSKCDGRSLSVTGTVKDESEPQTSCSSSDSEDQSETQSGSQSPSAEPVLLLFNQNVSDNVNISHVAVRPTPRQRMLVKRNADSPEGPSPEACKLPSSTTAQTEMIGSNITSSRLLSPEVTSCSTKDSTEGSNEISFETEKTEITLGKVPQLVLMNQSQSMSGSKQTHCSEDSKNVPSLNTEPEEICHIVESLKREDKHLNVYAFDSPGLNSSGSKQIQTKDVVHLSESLSEDTAFGFNQKSSQLLSEVPSVETLAFPLNVRKPFEHTCLENPVAQVSDFRLEYKKIEYKIPKLSPLLLSHAEDEVVSCTPSDPQVNTGAHELNEEKESGRILRDSVKDEVEINQGQPEITLPTAQTVEHDKCLLEEEPKEIQSLSFTTSYSVTSQGIEDEELTDPVAILNVSPRYGFITKVQLSSDSSDASTAAATSGDVEGEIASQRPCMVPSSKPHTDHMTRLGTGATDTRQNVAAGSPQDTPKLTTEPEDKWTFSFQSPTGKKEGAENTCSTASFSDEEMPKPHTDEGPAVHSANPVQLLSNEPSLTELLITKHSGAGRRPVRASYATQHEMVESADNPFEVRRGSPLVPAVKDVPVGEEIMNSEHVSSNVDVHPPRPEDQAAPSVQLGTGNYKVPAIVVLPPHSGAADGSQEGTQNPTTSAKLDITRGIIASTEEWEDEALDTDDDQSSVSSYGSERSSRKSHLSNALSAAGRTGSLLSIYSGAGDFGNVTVQGAVEFAIMYSPAEEFIIMVEQCQDLAYGNARKQRTDPYVKTYLLPDRFRRTKRKTSIKKNNINPIYVESLRYKIKKKDLQNKILHLSVWHNDSKGRNVFLGQVELNLNTWDWGHEALTWYNLLPKGGEAEDCHEFRGSLLVALKYVPTGGSKLTLGEVHVWLKQAKDLSQAKSHNVDTFVKCYMLPDTSKKSRQKTRVVKKSQSPVYNHAMVFDGFRSGEVREACCELTVWEHHRHSANQFLGGVRLSSATGKSYGNQVDWMDSANKEVEIWERMLSEPNTWVESELPLRSSMTPRK